MNLQELQKLTDAMMKASGGTSRQLRDLDKILNDVNINLKKEAEDYHRELQKLNVWRKRDDADRVENIKILEQDIQDRKRAVEENKNLLRQHSSGERARQAELKKLQGELRVLHEKRKSDDTEYSAYHLEQERRRLQANIDSLQNQEQFAAGITKTNKTINDEIKRLEQTAAQQRNELAEFSWKDVTGKMKSRVTDEIASFAKKAFDPSLLLSGLKGSLDYAREVMATGGDWIYSDLSRRMEVAKLGLSADEYLEMNTAHRHLIQSMGGMDNALSVVGESVKSIEHNFKTPGDAAKYATQMFDVMSKNGIQPTAEGLNKLNTSFKNLQVVTGITGEQFRHYIEDYTKSMEVQSEMRMLNQRQRAEALQSLSLRMQENAAIGISIERTIEMNKLASKMGQETYIERNRRSARIRSGAAGIGMGAEGNELGNLILKGRARWNDDDNKRFQELSMSINSRLEDLRAQGGNNPQLEIFADSIEKAVFQQPELIGRASEMGAAKLEMETRKLSEDITGAVDKAAATQNEVPEELKVISSIASQIEKVLSDSMLTSIRAGFGAVISTMIGGRALQMGKRAGGKLLGKITGRGAGAAGKAAGRAAGAGGKVAASTAKSIAKEVTEEVAEKSIGKIIAKQGLKAGLKAVPILGAIMGLGYGAKRAFSGDFVGAGMEVASGAASLLPTAGTATSLGIEAALIARDSGILDKNKEQVDEAKEEVKEVQNQVEELADTVESYASSPAVDPVTREVFNQMLNQLVKQTEYLSIIESNSTAVTMKNNPDLVQNNRRPMPIR